MPSRTVPRRRLLAAGSGLLSAAIAGCAGDSSSSGTVVESDERGGTFESSHEYESLFVRSDGGNHFIYRNEDDANEAAEAEDEDGYVSPAGRSTLFVLDADDVADLWVDASDADTEASDIRAFVDETDFETQSIVVEQRTIEDCYDRRLLGVRASDDDFRTQYCRSLKEPTTPCEADKTVMEAIVLRVDRPYDESPSSRGSSESGSCRRPIVTHTDGNERSSANENESENESNDDESESESNDGDTDTEAAEGADR